MLAIVTIMFLTFFKSPPLFIECSQSFTSDSDTVETVAFQIALNIPKLWRQHAAIRVHTEISRSKDNEATQEFLYLVSTFPEPNFSDFHDIVHSSEVAVLAASGR